MRNLLIVFFVGLAMSIQAQKIDYNTDKGFIAQGYDVTEYFNNKAVKGDKNYIKVYDGVKYKFASKSNLDKFISNPDKFVPQYGGYCAYAVGAKSEKVAIDPETFEIRDGKLYLFYNSWGINTLTKWNEEGAESLKTKADTNWENIKTK